MAEWIKLLGSSTPASSRCPNDWIPSHRVNNDLIQIESGPRTSMPPFEIGDTMILVAAGWSRAFAAVEIVRGPDRAETPRWGTKWPWVLLVRPRTWFPRIADAPKVTDAGLPRSFGSSYQRITQTQYDAAIQALRERGAQVAR